MFRRMAGLVGFAACAALAQNAASAPAFEVASIKLAPPAGATRTLMTGGPGSISPGQFRCLSMSLRPLLLSAYSLMPYQLDGPAKLLDGAKYDIVAKIPPGATTEDIDVMLQGLLAERFGLAVHWETREHSAYELVIAKGGLRMKEAAPPSADGRPADNLPFPRKDGWLVLPAGKPSMVSTTRNGITRLSARMLTAADLARRMERRIDRPIIDKTGLTGAYDFNLVYADDSLAAASPAAIEPSSSQLPMQGEVGAPTPTLVGAFEDQLGLKLNPAKGPIQVLVVDHLNKVPTEN